MLGGTIRREGGRKLPTCGVLKKGNHSTTGARAIGVSEIVASLRLREGEEILGFR